MTSFLDSSASPSLIDPKLFMESLENTLFAGKSLATLDQKNRHSFLDTHAAAARRLWTLFNDGRETFRKYYMDDRTALGGYLSSFFVPNVQRCFAITSSQELLAPLSTLVKESEGKLRILDVGAGPLSASAGLLFALQKHSATVGELKEIEVTAVERSEKAYDAGVKVLKNAMLSSVAQRFTLAPSIEKVETPIDIALCANVFNEIPEKHRLSTALSIFQRLVPGGLMIIVEPGQDLHARKLGLLRNGMIEALKNLFADVSVVAPCVHDDSCPLAEGTGRKDWCWFRTAWTPPALLTSMDGRTGLDHRELVYSYVVLQKKLGSAERPEARVVSDRVPIRFEHQGDVRRFLNWATANLVAGDAAYLGKNHGPDSVFIKTLCCCQKGRLESIVAPEGERALLERGAIVERFPIAICRCQERVESGTKKP